MTKFCFLLFPITLLSLNKAISQKKSDYCDKIKPFVQLFKNWKHNDSLPQYPLLKRQAKAVLGDNMIRRESAQIYSVKEHLPNEFKSEAGIDLLNRCFYTVFLGPFTADNVDSAGNAYKSIIAACDFVKHWKVSTLKGLYFRATSNLRIDKIDMFISLLKVQAKQKDKYWIKLFMYRY